MQVVACPGPALRWPGSKWTLAAWIVAHLPPHRAYLEPYFGSGAVLFAKPPAPLETVNDLDGEVVNLFRVIRERTEELAWAVEWTPWAREEYDRCRTEAAEEPVERARRFLVRLGQCIGRPEERAHGWRNSTHYRVTPTLQWRSMPDRLRWVADRLRSVQIECRPALAVIAAHSRPDTLVYADPPYLTETCDPSGFYAHTMTADEHAEMLAALQAHSGPVILSGYAHPLYDETLAGWTRRDRRALANAGQIRTESLWLNPVAARALSQKVLDL